MEHSRPADISETRSLLDLYYYDLLNPARLRLPHGPDAELLWEWEPGPK